MRQEILEKTKQLTNKWMTGMFVCTNNKNTLDGQFACMTLPQEQVKEEAVKGKSNNKRERKKVL